MPSASWLEMGRNAGQRGLQDLSSIWKSFRRFSASPLAGLPATASCPSSTGIYDCQGVLRFAGRDHADCVAYAELFGLDLLRCSITALVSRNAEAASSGEAGSSTEALCLPALT